MNKIILPLIMLLLVQSAVGEDFDYASGDYSTLSPQEIDMTQVMHNGRMGDVTVDQWSYGNNLEFADDISKYDNAKQSLQQKFPVMGDIQGKCSLQDGKIIGNGVSQDLDDPNLQQVDVDMDGNLIIATKEKSVLVEGRSLIGSAKLSRSDFGISLDEMPYGSKLTIEEDGVTSLSGKGAEVDIVRVNDRGDVETSMLFVGDPQRSGSAVVNLDSSNLYIEMENSLFIHNPGDGDILFDEFSPFRFRTDGGIAVTDNPETIGLINKIHYPLDAGKQKIFSFITPTGKSIISIENDQEFKFRSSGGTETRFFGKTHAFMLEDTEGRLQKMKAYNSFYGTTDLANGKTMHIEKEPFGSRITYDTTIRKLGSGWRVAYVDSTEFEESGRQAQTKTLALVKRW